MDRSLTHRMFFRSAENERVQKSRARNLLPGLIAVACLAIIVGCSASQKQVGIPPEAQTAIDAISQDIDAGRDDKIYEDASDEWKKASSPEQTKEFFAALRTKLGKVKTRTFHTARVEENLGGSSPGKMITVQYQTSFERGEGMETFTLVERDGRVRLARYFVNSDVLK